MLRSLMLGCVAAGLFMGAIVLFTITSLGQQSANAQGAMFGPSDNALADIPRLYLTEYMKAAESRGIDWAILAAIGSIETDHGRSTAAGVASGVNFAGCCAGPMQFLIQPHPSTWDAYAVDGNRDGRACPEGSAGCVYDPQDAIPAAADYLVASGAPGDYERAIFAYNHAGWYVAQVLAKAAEYRGALLNAGGTLGQVPGQLAINVQGASAVLELADGPRPRIVLNAIHRNDLSTGQVDARVTSLLVAAARRHTIRVSALKGDHDYYTSGGRPSNHAFGRAVDIAEVDGVACNSVAQGTAGPCWRLGREIAQITGPLHPTELIYGLDLDGTGPAFAAGDHVDHIHAGWEG